MEKRFRQSVSSSPTERYNSSDASCSRRYDIENERLPPTLIEPGEPHPEPVPLPSFTDEPHGPPSPSSVPYGGSPYMAAAAPALLSPRPKYGAFVGTTRSSAPSMRRRTLEEMDILLKGMVLGMDTPVD